LILVDTSIWVDHLRAGDPHLRELLQTQQVATHPFIIGEVALCHLRQRNEVMNTLGKLPKMSVADHDEVLLFIGAEALFGSGIGFVDASLLASVRLTVGTLFWTRDKNLLAMARRLRLAYGPN